VALPRLAAAVALAVLAALLPAGPADAHATLRSSTPADGARLPRPPAEVTLTFSERLQAGFTRVAATGPGGQSVAAGPVRVAGPRAVLPLRATAAGDYAVSYRVVSSDGHPVQGTIRFSAAAPAPTTAPPTTTPPATSAPPTGTAQPSPAVGTDDEGGTAWPYLGLGVLLAVLAVGGVLLVTSRRSAERRGPGPPPDAAQD
jgi:copper resistance protein C